MLNYLFSVDRSRHYGVARFNVYLLRILYLLIAVFVGRASWSYIATYEGEWNPVEAVSWCVWAAYSVLSVLGIVHPVKMLPIVLLEIIYKVLWLVVVAYPLWATGRLEGSAAEDLTATFMWVLLAIVATPWKYVWETFIWAPKNRV